MTEDDFEVVGIRTRQETLYPGKKWYKKPPLCSMGILLVIALGCIFAEMIMTKNPTYLDLANSNKPPNWEFLFGTDTLGRDVFSMIWSGGRISLCIGVLSTIISTLIAILFGAVSGVGSDRIDVCMMRFTEIILSVPNLLLVIFFQAILGKANVWTISMVIGFTSWASMAKVVRSEVRQIRNSEYVLASKCMGGGFWHILWHHLIPNFISAIMFMVVMNIRNGIILESTLSFMGMGLPLEQISWGSILSLAQKAILTKSWWMILIPGLFLIVTLVCVTNIGNYIRRNVSQRPSYL